MMVFPAENARRTFADVLVWDENERAEIIDGQVFMMAPPSRVHQEISGELFRQLANFLDGKKCRVYTGAKARLILLLKSSLLPPDGMTGL